MKYVCKRKKLNKERFIKQIILLFYIGCGMNKKLIVYFGILLVLGSFVDAIIYTQDILEQGQSKTYILDGTSYGVEVTYIGGTQSKVKFKINGEVTSLLAENEKYNLQDEASIKVINIMEEEAGEVNSDLVEFKLTGPPVCGDAVCSEKENCIEDDCCSGIFLNLDSNEDNCGSCGNKCNLDEECDKGNCKPICGDKICSSGENCEKDNCCNGIKVDLQSDLNNCGECNKRCNTIANCEKGICISTCGNGKCDFDEDSTICEVDCPKPVSIEEDETLETQKVEETEENKCDGCFIGESCIPKGTSGLNNEERVYCDGKNWIEKKSPNSECIDDYECEINSCIDHFCKEKVQEKIITQTSKKSDGFFGWFKSLFGF